MVQENEASPKWAFSRIFNLEMLMFTITVLSGLIVIWQLVVPDRSVAALALAGVTFTLSMVAVFRLIMDPDALRARQTDDMLKLARQSFACLQGGMDGKAAQKICELLLPTTAAIAVAVTDKEELLGYAGFEEAENPAGNPIRTRATQDTLGDGEMRILLTPEEIGFPSGATTIKAAIVVPLRVGKRVEGTLKFYYRSPRHISATQKSIAEGFGQLISTQMSAEELEEQTKLATSMELKALQSQINPHFLFNTINTIASLIRTDPAKARTLLREFAVFYRRTLEDSADLIMFSRELEQTLRYFSFEIARFGEDRVGMTVGVDEGVEDMLVPPFLIQPLVENAVHHAMPSEGKLLVTLTAEIKGDNLVIGVADDGVGMTEEAREKILCPESSTGMGIAVKNVHDRMRGYFGPESHLEVESELGKGTKVSLVLSLSAIKEYQDTMMSEGNLS